MGSVPYVKKLQLVQKRHRHFSVSTNFIKVNIKLYIQYIYGTVFATCYLLFHEIREHPFNLKAMGFSESQFFLVRSAAELFFATSCSDIIFFSTKNNIF